MKYKDIITLNERFQPAYDLENEIEDHWKTFIPTDKFREVLSKTLDSLTTNRIEDKQSIWIQGTYGTGKSHAAAVIKHLLTDETNILNDFDIKNPQLEAKLKSFREKKKIFPIIIKGTSGISDAGEFRLQIQRAVKKSLQKAGLDFRTKTDFQTLIEVLNEGHLNFESLFKGTEIEKLYGDKEKIIKLLENEDINIQRKIEKILLKNAININSTSSIHEWLKEINNELKERGIADSLIIFWDEFTGIMDLENISPIITEVQNIAELSAKHDIYLFIISHRTPYHLKNKGKDEDLEKILGRFKLIEYSMETITTYHLIENSIKKKNPQKWESLKNNHLPQIKDIIEKISGHENNTTQSLENIFPIHPYTAFIATIIARNIGSTERSIFKFLYDEKKGFKKFLNSNIKEKPFLTTDYLWDFFLTDFNRIENEKVYSVMERYKLYNNKLKKSGENYTTVFKTILLLNLIYRLVELSETSILKPTTKNISNILKGHLNEKKVEDILNHIDKNKIINKNPDGLFIISSSSLPPEEIEKEKETLKKIYNKVTKILNSEQEKELKNNINALREIEIKILDAPRNTSNLKSILEKKFKKDYAVPIALFLSINNSEKEKIRNQLLETSKHIKNKLLILSDKELGEDGFNRFLDYKSRSIIAGNHNYNDEKEENEDHAKKTIDKWINEILNTSVTCFFNGEEKKLLFRKLGKEIEEYFSPRIFNQGLENIKINQNKNVWKPEKSKKAAEIFLFSENRSVIEEKATGIDKYLLSILKDNDGSYIVDTNLNLKKDIINHPLKQMQEEIKKTIETQTDNNFNLGDELKFLSKPPYGLYKSKINIAALSFLMRQYIDNFFDSGTGIQWTKERMRDRILEIFNYWETNKNRNKLHIRKGSEEETRIIECISNIFNFKGLESLNDTKWEIKKWVDKEEFPLWLFKYTTRANEKTSQKFKKIFEFTKMNDNEINPEKLKELLNEITDYEIDLKSIIIQETKNKPETWKKAFCNWAATLNIEKETISEKSNEILTYLKKNMQESISHWDEKETESKFKDWIINHTPSTPHEPVLIKNPKETRNQIDKDIEGSGNEETEKLKNKIKKSDREKLEKILIKLIEDNPYITEEIRRLMGRL
ncbi:MULTISPECIES: hypothetical protein [Methanothermobacter]|uniref:DUF6079 domain-containing protein n=1 Tax=Methanothermobacter wolfeii TaxID=145261 RepID=A0A9E7RW67_METWO|nr:hypothetical protein [Methanothermobacter wolfeii]UXH32547.1 hypothetical protein N5910_04510 [Methanothermobacter wolfeii]